MLAALRWRRDDLDPALPPAIGYVGGYYLVLAVRTRERLADLAYDFDRLGAIMAERDWTTIQLVWREDRLRFHSRNPFPPGGVVEDPATGAAAAALGDLPARARDTSSRPPRSRSSRARTWAGRAGCSSTCTPTGRRSTSPAPRSRYELSSARTSAANASTSSSAVSHDAIQRTSPVPSSQT